MRLDGLVSCYRVRIVMSTVDFIFARSPPHLPGVCIHILLHSLLDCCILP